MYMDVFDSKLDDVDEFNDRKLLFAGRRIGHVKNVLTTASTKDSIRIEFGEIFWRLTPQPLAGQLMQMLFDFKYMRVFLAKLA